MFLVWCMQFFAWLSKRGRYKCHLHFPSPFKSDSLIYFEEGNLVPRLQGDPSQNLLIQMATTLKICISDPMLIKPKCVWEASIYFHFSAVCLEF